MQRIFLVRRLNQAKEWISEIQRMDAGENHARGGANAKRENEMILDQHADNQLQQDSKTTI